MGNTEIDKTKVKLKDNSLNDKKLCLISDEDVGLGRVIGGGVGELGRGVREGTSGLITFTFYCHEYINLIW